MARKRMVDPSFFQSESLAECTFKARLCFIGLWCHAKDDGRMKFQPRSMKASIFPMDEMTMGDFLSMLTELEEEGCIRFYVNGGDVYLDIPGFSTYQTISHPQKSNIPEYSRSVPVMLHECSMNVPPKELIKELINKGERGNADAPHSHVFDAGEYLKSFGAAS